MINIYGIANIKVQAVSIPMVSKNSQSSGELPKMQQPLLEQGQEEEIWRAAVGFEGRYEISNLGRLRTVSQPIYGWLGQSGYQVSKLRKNDSKTEKNVNFHRLVAEAFIPMPELKGRPVVNHLDGNKLNNKVDNLEWTNQSGNVAHAHRTGLIDKSRNGKSSHSKITQEQAEEIRDIYEKGGTTYAQLAGKYGLSSGGISFILRTLRTKGKLAKMPNIRKSNLPDETILYILKEGIFRTPMDIGKELGLSNLYVGRLIRIYRRRIEKYGSQVVTSLRGE